MKFAWAIFLLLSISSCAQNSIEFFKSWDNELAKRYHLDSISASEKDSLFIQEDIRTSNGIRIFLVEKDSTNESFNIQYSQNFDEAGYSLTVINEQGLYFVFMNEGDHCCDWIVFFDAYELKKGRPVSLNVEDYWPGIGWNNFLTDVPSTNEYPFLSSKPVYYLSYDGEVITAILAAEYYSLSYDKGNTFLDEYAETMLDVKLVWKKNKFVFI